MNTDSKLTPFEGKAERALSVVTKTEEWVPSEPVDTPEAFESQKRKLRMKYESSFATEEEFELFCMMPVNGSQRELLFAAMQKERRTKETVNDDAIME